MDKITRDVTTTVHRWWRRIRQSGQNERGREFADAQAWATGALDGLRTEQERVREEFLTLNAAWFASRSTEAPRTPRESYYHSVAARYCNVAGWCVTALEAVFAGGLSILLLALPWMLGAAVGMIITILLAVGLKGVIAPLVVGRYADRPKAGRDLALTLLIITGPVALTLLAVIFVVRGVAGNWAAWLFPWATGGLAVICPIIAAALFVLAGLYGWSRWLTGQYRALEQAERDVTELRDHCIRGLAPLTTPLGSTVHGTRVAGAAALTKVGTAVALAAVLLNGVGCSEQLQAQVDSSSTGSRLSQSMTTSTVTGELWLDDTISVDERDRPRAAHAVLATLVDVSKRYLVERWVVFGFGEEPWRESSFHEMTFRALQPPACDPPTEASRIFKVHQEDSVCEERQRAAEATYQEQIHEQIVRMQRAMREHRLEPARCTGIADLLLRVSQAPGRRLAVIITDGVETCRASGLPPIPPPHADSRVAIVLIGSAARPGKAAPTLGEQFAARRQTLLKAAPWLRVVAPWEVTTGLFEPAGSR